MEKPTQAPSTGFHCVPHMKYLYMNGNQSGSGGEDLTLSLPDELLEKVFAFLPILYVVRARAVCIRWNVIASSSWFLTAYRRSSPPSAPWYFMFNEPHRSDGLIYDPQSKKWYNFSLPCTKGSPWIVASSNGLACFADNNDGYGLFACNPMTKDWKCIPVPSRKWCPQTLYYYAVSMAVDEMTGVQTTVVARSNRIGEDCTHWSITIEVRDSATQIWQTVDSTILDGWRGGENSVICDGIFYCVIHSTTAMVGLAEQQQHVQHRHGLMLCELATGRLRTPIVGMPTSLTCVRLMNCKEKLIMVGGIGKSDVVTGIGVWELDGGWRKVSIMPDKFLRGFSELDDVFSCSGAGELIYIHGYGSPKLLVFNLRRRSWQWSQRCPLMKKHPLHIFTGFCFQPRLDPPNLQ